MVSFGIRLASFPSSDRTSGNAKDLSQSCLGQPDRHAQRQHPLTEGTIELSK
jgi:hypothetical protein